jgi:hypothetical protein
MNHFSIASRSHFQVLIQNKQLENKIFSIRLKIRLFNLNLVIRAHYLQLHNQITF